MRPDSVRQVSRPTSAMIVLALVLAACGSSEASTFGTTVYVPSHVPSSPRYVPSTLTAQSQLPLLVARIDRIRSQVRDDVYRSYSELQAGAKGPKLSDLQGQHSIVARNFNAWIREYQTAVDQGASLQSTNADLRTALNRLTRCWLGLPSCTNLTRSPRARPGHRSERSVAQRVSK